MAQEENVSMSIVAEAEELMKTIERQMAAFDDLYREAGIDREKLLAAMTPHTNALAEKQLQEDRGAIEQEVEAARENRLFSAASKSSRGNKHRSMI